MQKRILVSGFEAFGGAGSNPSAMICERLAAIESLRPVDREVRIETVILPVTFAGAFEKLRSEIERVQPDVVLALGQAGGRASIDFERIAVNLIDSETPDNFGVKIQNRTITENGPAAHFSRLPLRALESAVTQLGIPAGVSNTAGLYVCNFLFYKLMEFTKESCAAGFVHLPYTPEQAKDADRRTQERTGRDSSGESLNRAPARAREVGAEPPGAGRVASLEFEKMLSAVQASLEVLIAPDQGRASEKKGPAH